MNKEKSMVHGRNIITMENHIGREIMLMGIDMDYMSIIPMENYILRETMSMEMNMDYM
jgi:hypothetical protein